MFGFLPLIEPSLGIETNNGSSAGIIAMTLPDLESTQGLEVGEKSRLDYHRKR
jgi:hypothetical protein